MEQWRIVERDGNPEKEGIYDVVLIYDEVTAKEVKNEHIVPSYEYELTGRQFAFMDSRSFEDAKRCGSWAMKGQPDEGLVWSQESGSCYNERVYAWLPPREFPDIELPEGVEWEKDK